MNLSHSSDSCMPKNNCNHEHEGHHHSGVGHSHAPTDFKTAFIIGITLNTAFVIIEAGYGFFAGSMALLADAGHNLSDVLGLFIAWGAHFLSQKNSSETRTYGYKKTTILASLANGIILLFALGAIAWEAVIRLHNPEPVEGFIIITVAGIGVLINAFTALLFASGRKGDLNIRGAYLHMAADAAISLGVVISGIIILKTEILWIDPFVSLLIAAVILVGTWDLLKEAVNLAVDAVPAHIDMQRLQKYFSEKENIIRYHDLHVWALSTTEPALTVHLVVKSPDGNSFLYEITHELHHIFGIGHSTIQIETESDSCPLDKPMCN